MANNKNLKPFKKGDPRINRNGRPKSFDTLRKLAKQIAHEEAKGKDGETIVVDNHKVTIAEAILRKWATNPKFQQLFIEYAFGKVPTRTDITSGGDKIPAPIIYLPDNGRDSND